MDFEFFNEISAWLESLLGAVNDLPGGVAFVLGVVAWFLVEKLIRRLGDMMRGVLIIGLVAFSGISGVALVNFFMSNGKNTEGLIPDLQRACLEQNAVWDATEKTCLLE